MESGELLPRPRPPVSSEADRRGGWRAALFILSIGFLERIGFFGVQGNLIMYLIGPLGMSTAAAAAAVNAWFGTVQVLPLVGALAADSGLGRYRAVLAAGVLYLLSFGMMTVSSMLQTPQHHPANCQGPASIVCSSTPSTSPANLVFFYTALYLMALAQGFSIPCSEAFGADQFGQRHNGGGGGDPRARAMLSSYFNWFHFSISWGYALASTVVAYVEDNVGWTVGFATCWATMVLYLSIFLLGTPTYRAEQPADDGNPFARLAGALSANAQAWASQVVFPRKDNTGIAERLVPIEDAGGKGFVVKLLPIWLSTLVFATTRSQVGTLFIKQGSMMDRRLGPRSTDLVVPPAALQCLISITYITLIPFYDRVLVPLARRFTRHPAGITMLQRVGTGMAFSCVSMAVAALVEAKRLRVAMAAGLVDQPDVPVPMSLWWVVPQYVLAGFAEVFGIIGLEEFFYDQVPDALRSVGLALCLSILGAGSYISGMLVSAIDRATASGGESWFSDNLNRAHLDYFYWLLAGLSALGVVVFLCFAKRYVYRSKSDLCSPSMYL